MKCFACEIKQVKDNSVFMVRRYESQTETSIFFFSYKTQEKMESKFIIVKVILRLCLMISDGDQRSTNLWAVYV